MLAVILFQHHFRIYTTRCKSKLKIFVPQYDDQVVQKAFYSLQHSATLKDYYQPVLTCDLPFTIINHSFYTTNVT